MTSHSDQTSVEPTAITSLAQVPTDDPVTDADRLMALERSGLLADDGDVLRRYTEIARAATGLPMVAVSFVTATGQILKGGIGFGGLTETPLDASTCAIVVRSDAPLIVSDTDADPRTRDLASAGLGTRAYAGFPLRTSAGVLGSLCALDTEPREWSDSELRVLQQIAESVQTEIQFQLDRHIRHRVQRWANTQNRLLTAAVEGGELHELTSGFALALADHFPGAGVLIAVLVEGTTEVEIVATSDSLAAHDLTGVLNGHPEAPALRAIVEEEVISDSMTVDWGEFGSLMDSAGLTRSVSLCVPDGNGTPLASITLIVREPVFAGMRDRLHGLDGGAALLRTLIQNARARTRLAKSEERLNLALRSTSKGVFDWLVADDVLIMSDRWLELAGVAPSAKPGMSSDWTDRIHPDDRDRTLARLDAVLHGPDEDYDDEHRIVTPEGESIWLHWSGRVVERDADSAPIRMTGTFLDVTARKVQEFALERLSAAIANLNDAVLISDPAADMGHAPIIRFANPAVSRVLGLEPDQLLGQTTEAIFQGSPEHLRLLREARGELLAGRPARILMQVNNQLGEELWVEVVTQPIHDASVSKGFWVSVARDVTQRIEAENELAASREQLRHAQKMEAVGRLAGGMAHDFNNLLTAVLGYGEFIAEAAPAGSSLRQDADEIVGAASRGQAITRQLLAFSRKNAWNPSTFGLNEVLTTVERLIHRIIGEDVNLMVLPATMAGHVETDRNQLEQAVVNLAINARDALARGGTVSLSTESLELSETLQAVPEPVPPGQYEVVTVRDDGVGIAPGMIQHIFEPFFTTKEPGKGTGLGLATVYGTVKQGDGFVTVQSTPGEGTTFRIFLPRSGETSALSGPTDALGDQGFQGSGTILVVEDEVQVRNLVVRMLRHVGYQVYEAKHGRDALLIWEQNREEIDLILTDVVMPEMNGVELAEALHALDPSLPILFMSGYTGGSTGGRDVSRVIPAEDLLSKPFSTPDLLLRVRARLDGVRAHG